MPSVRSWSMILPLLVSVACSEGGSGNGTPDSGIPVDSGQPSDSGTDAANPTDAGPVAVCPHDGVNFPTVADYCAEYQTRCGFGTAGYYASMQECTTEYQALLAGPSADTTAASCRTNHLCFVTVGPSVHCEHSAGTAICQ